MTTTNAVLTEWIKDAERKARESRQYQTATKKASRAHEKLRESRQDRDHVDWQFRNCCIALASHHNGENGFRENMKKLAKLQKEWEKASKIHFSNLQTVQKYDNAAFEIVENAKKAVADDPETQKKARKECKRRNRRAKQINRLIASQTTVDRRNSNRRPRYAFHEGDGGHEWFILPNRRFYRYLAEKFGNKKYFVSRASGNCASGTEQFLKATGGKLPARGSKMARVSNFQKAVIKASSIAIYHHRKRQQNNNGKGA